MPPTSLQSAIEALLFASDQPLPLTLLCDALETGPEEVSGALHRLGEAYVARAAGVELREIAGGWMLVTTAEQAEWVGRMLRGKRKMRLSRAALETTAIIAYKQPVTKSEVEAIRGVDSSAVLGTLLERNLVTIRGRSKVVGRPLLYGTTQEFLDYFGLRDLSELPRPEELRALVAAREPEQLDMMELEVVSQVASDLAASEAAHPELVRRHEIVPLEGGDALGQAAAQVATDFAPAEEPSLSDLIPAERGTADEAEEAVRPELPAALADEPGRE
jgi:segregation and condensation protein B